MGDYRDLPPIDDVDAVDSHTDHEHCFSNAFERFPPSDGSPPDDSSVPYRSLEESISREKISDKEEEEEEERCTWNSFS